MTRADSIPDAWIKDAKRVVITFAGIPITGHLIGVDQIGTRVRLSLSEAADTTYRKTVDIRVPADTEVRPA